MKKIALNRHSPLPLHAQLSNSIKEQILTGMLHPGNPLPSEGDMASSADVSTAVVRQAYSYLRRAGLVITQQGKGSFVAEKKPTMEFVQKRGSSYEEAVEKGSHVETKVLEFEEIAEISPDLKVTLELSPDDSLLKLTRLRTINAIKMFLWTSYLPFKVCRSLLSEDFSTASLYKTLKQKLNINVVKAKRWVNIVKAEPYQAELLDILELEPLFCIENIAYTETGIPIEYYKGWYRSEYTKFYFELEFHE
jgi:GntR family transcriptional regulator